MKMKLMLVMFVSALLVSCGSEYPVGDVTLVTPWISGTRSAKGVITIDASHVLDRYTNKGNVIAQK